MGGRTMDNSKKNNTENKSITEILEEVREDICDNYCKYRGTVDEDCVCDIMRNGNTCLLDQL